MKAEELRNLYEIIPDHLARAELLVTFAGGMECREIIENKVSAKDKKLLEQKVEELINGSGKERLAVLEILEKNNLVGKNYVNEMIDCYLKKPAATPHIIALKLADKYNLERLSDVYNDAKSSAHVYLDMLKGNKFASLFALTNTPEVVAHYCFVLSHAANTLNNQKDSKKYAKKAEELYFVAMWVARGKGKEAVKELTGFISLIEPERENIIENLKPLSGNNEAYGYAR